MVLSLSWGFLKVVGCIGDGLVLFPVCSSYLVSYLPTWILA